MFGKYKYHEKVLDNLNNRRIWYLEQVKNNKDEEKHNYYGSNYGFSTAEEISTELNIDLIKTNATLLDLTELGLIDFMVFGYFAKENTGLYLNSGYFNKKETEYKQKKYFNHTKDALLIILGVFSIFTFFKSQIYPDTSTNKQLKELQEKVKSIQEQVGALQQTRPLLLSVSIN